MVLEGLVKYFLLVRVVVTCGLLGTFIKVYTHDLYTFLSFYSNKSLSSKKKKVTGNWELLQAGKGIQM